MTKPRIEGVQPIVKPATKLGPPFKYPFNVLKQGQSFWQPETKAPWVNLYVAVWRENRKDASKQYALSKGDRDGKPGFRVQRTR